MMEWPECWVLNKKEKIKVTEIKMVICIIGTQKRMRGVITSANRTENLEVTNISGNMKEHKLRWFGNKSRCNEKNKGSNSSGKSVKG